MRTYGCMLVLLSAVLTSGCSREEANEDVHETESAESNQGGLLPEDNVFSDQVKALEKAEDVQQTLDAAAAKQREEIERQEQR